MERWFQIDYVSRIKEENVFHNPLRYTKATAHLPSMVARTNIKADSKSEAKSSFLDVATDVTEIVRILPLEMVFDGLIYEYVDTKDPEGIQRDIMGLLNITKESVEAGGAGVSFGRNIFQSRDPIALTKAISLIVHQNYSISDAISEAHLKIEGK